MPANQTAGAQVVGTILHDGKPQYFAIIVTHPGSGLTHVNELIAQRKSCSFAFGDKASTSGYRIPLHHFMQQGVADPEKHFAKVLYTKHQAIETQAAAGQIDAGADYKRNRNAMIEQGLISAERSRVIWQSAPLLKTQPQLLPAHHTGFVASDNRVYKPIRDAGLATGKLQPT